MTSSKFNTFSILFVPFCTIATLLFCLFVFVCFAPPKAKEDEVRHTGLSSLSVGKYVSNSSPWTLQNHTQCDYAFPCATENEIDSEAVRILVKMGIKGFFEGANMPITSEAQIMIQRENIVHIPGKAANGMLLPGLYQRYIICIFFLRIPSQCSFPFSLPTAGGVALTSVLDLAQDTQGLQWHEEEIERQLEQIMTGIYDQIEVPGVSFVDSANRCGFLKIAYAMKDLGWVYQI